VGASEDRLVTRAAIFDLDDTLYPYDTFVDSGFRAVSQYVSTVSDARASDVADFLRTLRQGADRGREFQVLCRAYGLAPSVVPTLVEVFRCHLPAVQLATGAATTLQALRAGGWGLAVLTNGHVAIQRRKVRALGVEALVDCVVYAEDHAAGGKPAPEAFEAVVARLRVSPSRAVMVGNDLEADISGAARAGLHAIHLRPSSQEFTGHPGAVGASCLSEVPSLAESLIPPGGADAC
jgi:putative hydrolase of the HAD superfamily